MSINNEFTQINFLLSFFMITGVIATSIGGALRAINAKMDITGAILLAFVAANGGGTVRDIILDTQVFWIAQQFYIWLTVSVGALTFIYVYYHPKFINNPKFYKLLIITDAMGLAAFCLAGVERSLNMGQNNSIAIIMGVWTAIGGGIVADIIANRIPLVLSQELYMSVALIGAISYLFISHMINPITASVISAILMIVLRLLSVKFKWKLPSI